MDVPTVPVGHSRLACLPMGAGRSSITDGRVKSWTHDSHPSTPTVPPTRSPPERVGDTRAGTCHLGPYRDLGIGEGSVYDESPVGGRGRQTLSDSIRFPVPCTPSSVRRVHLGVPDGLPYRHCLGVRWEGSTMTVGGKSNSLLQGREACLWGWDWAVPDGEHLLEEVPAREAVVDSLRRGVVVLPVLPVVQ